MTTLEKTQKLISLGKTRTGAPLGLYSQEASGLIAAGVLALKCVHSAVGARNLRLFVVGA